jgi:hypothetical protein
VLNRGVPENVWGEEILSRSRSPELHRGLVGEPGRCSQPKRSKSPRSGRVLDVARDGQPPNRPPGRKTRWTPFGAAGVVPRIPRKLVAMSKLESGGYDGSDRGVLTNS